MAVPGPCSINLSTLIPSCEALNSVAGVRDFFYACRRVDITGIVPATDGTITDVTITNGKLKKISGRKFQNSGAFALAANDLGKSRFTHTYNARIYFRSQAERNAIQALALVDDLVVFSPNNDNQFEVYGLTLGLAPSSLAGGTGIKLEDDNTALFAFTGTEPSLPQLFNSVVPATTDDTDFLTNVEYFDTLVGA